MQPSPKTYRLPNGLSVHYLSKTDTDFIYREVFEEDLYRKHGIVIRDGDCIFDIGANTGLFAVFLNQVCNEATVYAFEPIPAIFDILRRNLGLHDTLGVKPLNLGLSREPSQATFTYYPRLSCNSTMYPDESDAQELRLRNYIQEQYHTLPLRPLAFLLTHCPRFMKNALAELVRRFFVKKQLVTCTLTTVSTVMREYEIERIDLLKVDVERSELDILEGIAEDDWPKIRQAVVEVHEGDEALQAVEQHFIRHGFRTAVDRDRHFSNISMLYAVRAKEEGNGTKREW